MATVYLAHDLKHDRKVALKVLKPELAAVLGAERFVVEIKTTAALQHPHILPLFDSGTAEGFLYYVMPFINGETLRDKLNRERQMGVDEAVRIASEVADALHYAHQQGVIHRDIKPENILLANGRPMVADFGIALAVSAAAGGRMTETGLSLGTPHYMSPEQATAEKDISARSDVYSIASVLYEMLAGEPPHSGGTAQSIIMKIIAEPAPPVTKFRKSVPPHVAAALARALEKVPADRFASAGDFAHALADPTFRTVALTGSSAAAGERSASPGSRLKPAAVALLLLGSIAAAVAGWMRTPSAAPARVVALTETIPVSSQSWTIDVSPNGDRVTVVGGDQRIYDRQLDVPGMSQLDLEFGYGHRLSPDGNQMAYQTQAFDIAISRPSGGPVRTLVRNAGISVELLWGVDDFIYYENSSTGGIYRIPSAGGEPELLVPRDSGSRVWPSVLLPGERTLLYSKRVAAGATLHAIDLSTKETRELGPAPGPRGVAYSASGYLLQAEGKHLMAQRFDPKSLTFSGDAEVVAEVEAGGMRFGYANGTLAFAPALGGGAGTPYIVTIAGARRELPGFPSNGVMRPEVSPDGTRIAVTIASAPEASEGDVWVYDIAGGTLTRLTRSGGVQYSAWSRDGAFVYYSDNGDVFRVQADGSTPPELVLDRPAPIGRISTTVDGTRLLFQEASGAFNVGAFVLERPGSDTLLLREPYREGHMSISPDGRWLAYYSDESGRIQIYVRRVDDLSRKRQISIESASRPRWSGDGKTLYFVSSSELMLLAASLDVGDEIRVRGIRPLFQLPNAEYDLFPGDSLIAIAGRVESESAAAWWRQLTIIRDFDVVLRRLSTAGR